MMKPAANQQLYRLACQGPLTNPGVFMFGAQITRFPQVNLNSSFIVSIKMFPVLSGDGGKKSKKKDGKARASGTGSGSPVWGRRVASGGGSWPGLSSKGKGAKRDEIKTNKPSGGGAAAVRAPMGPDSSSGFAGASTAGRGRGRGRGNSGRSRGQSIGVGGGFAPAPSGRGWGSIKAQPQPSAVSWPGLGDVGDAGAVDEGVASATAEAEAVAARGRVQSSMSDGTMQEGYQGGGGGGGGNLIIQKAADRVEVLGLRSFAAVRDASKRTGLWGKQLSHLHLLQQKRTGTFNIYILLECIYCLFKR